LKVFLPYGYIKGQLKRLDDEEFELLKSGGKLKRKKNGVNSAKGDGGWKLVKRRGQRGGRNSLWRLWLKGLPSTDRGVRLLMQPYEQSPQKCPAEKILIDPWTLSHIDRLDLAHKYASLLACELKHNPLTICPIFSVYLII
jgi:hypothetical protein